MILRHLAKVFLKLSLNIVSIELVFPIMLILFYIVNRLNKATSIADMDGFRVMQMIPPRFLCPYHINVVSLYMSFHI